MSAPFFPRVGSRSTEVFERTTLEDADEFEDTQPSVTLPDEGDEFGDAPTIPGFRLSADDSALGAVAAAVKRVFAGHLIR